jgi:hypothetical protein
MLLVFSSSVIVRVLPVLVYFRPKVLFFIWPKVILFLFGVESFTHAHIYIIYF